MAGGKENETKFGFMHPLMVRGGVERRETEGIRRSETEQTIPQSCFACQLPLHKGAMVRGTACAAVLCTREP